MDPNENIKRQRELAAEIVDVDLPDEAVANLGAELAELVQALDEWRGNGGFDPYATFSDTPAWAASIWAQAYLRDARESEAIDRDVSDAVIEREAEKLERLIFQVASAFVDNEFDENA